MKETMDSAVDESRLFAGFLGRLQDMNRARAAQAEAEANAIDDADEDFFPDEPESVEATGLSYAEIEALILKYLGNCTTATGRIISDQLKLGFGLTSEVLRKLKNELLVAYKASAAMGDYEYELTDAGEVRAFELSKRCTYFGAAPVAFEDYAKSVYQQSLTRAKPREAQLHQAFADLQLNSELIDQLGQAMNAGRGLFLYGPPGNGKTSVAERVTKAYGQYIWIPRTISITGEMVRLYDPSSHELAPPEKASSLDGARVDQRWVRIKRPTIVVSGELTLEQLDIRYNPATGINEAPVHVKSNCGTLVVDDFGRQRVSSVDLLNRWIVPLEKHIDFLSLPSGRQIQVPFEQLLVLSTNIEPRSLVDEAFLRRIPYKIDLVDPTEQEFIQLFETMAEQTGVGFDKEALSYLIATHYHKKGRPFRFCHPRDLLLQIKNLCEYREQPLEMTPEHLDVAVKNYFADIENPTTAIHAVR